MQSFKSAGWTIYAAVHICPFQPRYFNISSPATRTIHYQVANDPVTRLAGRPGDLFTETILRSIPIVGSAATVEAQLKGAGRLSGAEYIESSARYDIGVAHASPIYDTGTWADIRNDASGLATL